ncbi:MAG: hypothetical protein ABIJ61_07815, partial [bacterium]
MSLAFVGLLSIPQVQAQADSEFDLDIPFGAESAAQVTLEALFSRESAAPGKSYPAALVVEVAEG